MSAAPLSPKVHFSPCNTYSKLTCQHAFLTDVAQYIHIPLPYSARIPASIGWERSVTGIHITSYGAQVRKLSAQPP